jgi:hypothetical protein
MSTRILAMGGAVIISLIAGSIMNTAIVFAGSAIIILAYWLLLFKVMP